MDPINTHDLKDLERDRKERVLNGYNSAKNGIASAKNRHITGHRNWNKIAKNGFASAKNLLMNWNASAKNGEKTANKLNTQYNN